MKNIFIAAIIGAVLAFGAFLAFRPSEPTYADFQRAQLQAEQAQALAPIWTIAQAIVILDGALLIIGIPTALVVALYARFRRNQRLVAPAGGIAPLLLDDSYAERAAAALASHHATQHQLASVQPVPHTFSPSQSYHYAPTPRIDYRSSVPEQLASYALPSLEAAIALTLPEVVRLADMLPTVPSGHLAYGMLTSGELLTLPLADGYHALFHGILAQAKRTRSTV